MELDLSQPLAVLREFLDYRLVDISGTPVSVATVFTLLAMLLLAALLSRVIQRAAARAFRARNVSNEGTLQAVRRLTHYTVMVLGFGIALQTVGINLSALFAAGAVFAVGVGFAMQNITQNFVSGVILLLERSIKPGDVLLIEQRFVKVEEMGIRATQARSLDDEEIIVPNSTIVQSVVTNYTMRDSYYRLRGVVGVTYSSDMRLVRSTLEQVAADLPWKSAFKKPVVLLSEFGDSSVNWEVSVWIEDPWAVRKMKSDLLEAIWNAFLAADITIAFPQLDVHFDPPIVGALEGLRAAG